MPNPETFKPSQGSYEFSTQNHENHEANEYEPERGDRELGAKVLSQINFERRHQPIVDSSFDKSRQKGEKLPGKSSERRNHSYLSRIENLVAEHGNRLEQRLWEMSADKLVISPDDITDDYWRAQDQNNRDNGQGPLTSHEKEAKIREIQTAQEQSLKTWSNYLGSEESPYPIWFKVYAWEGMSKMGTFDKEKGQFAKRDKHTVAPYPRLNPAVLAKTYGAVMDFYGQQDRSVESPNDDIEMMALVGSGNFNKLYSKILLSEKAIPKTPERTEGVHGEWLEYLPGEEEKLAEAAEGTPWCVKDPGTGRNYLEYGSYHDEPELPEGENKAKFILFHLQNPETNTLSNSACASIRLGLDGRVAEISGLNENQTLEDSLVPIVEEKAKNFPGCEKYLRAFADGRQLTLLDRKMQNNEDLTREEYEFLYEVERPIESLHDYEEDPRIEELRHKYWLKPAIEAGLDADQLVRQADRIDIQRFDWNRDKGVDWLVERGAGINNLFPKVDTVYLLDEPEFYISRGADVEALSSHIASHCEPGDLSTYPRLLDTLIAHGEDIDHFVSCMEPLSVKKDLDTLLAHGAHIDTKALDEATRPRTFEDFASHVVELEDFM